MRVFSYGGGVQSTAALVLAAQARIDYKTFLFCNVGDDSEHPETLKYVHEVAMPYAATHGIELIELQKTRFGEPETLIEHLTRPGGRSIPIPVRMSKSGAPGNRSCTADFKIKVVDRWLRERGAKNEGATVGLGISFDEIQRMKPNMDPHTAWKENDFPLILGMSKPLTRQDCLNIIADVGLPTPPKSACWFCPYHSLRRWQEMRTKEPDLFWKAVELERFMNERLSSLVRDPVWLTSKLKPLDQATTDLEQQELFEDDYCESGYCMV